MPEIYNRICSVFVNSIYTSSTVTLYAVGVCCVFVVLGGGSGGGCESVVLLLLLGELVPLGDLPPGGGDHLVPVVEGRPLAAGTAQLQPPNDLEQRYTGVSEHHLPKKSSPINIWRSQLLSVSTQYRKFLNRKTLVGCATSRPSGITVFTHVKASFFRDAHFSGAWPPGSGDNGGTTGRALPPSRGLFVWP